MHIFSEYESNVRTYCRSFPVVFNRAKAEHIWDVDGNKWLDFFCSAGSQNLGHNPATIKTALLKYLEFDGIINSLDLHTEEKRRYLENFSSKVLEKRGLGDYKFQFVGPTGTDCVEAALRLARKATGRESIVALKRSYHGMTLGAASVSDSLNIGRNSGVQYIEQNCWSSLAKLEKFAPSNRPAAVIIEIVQCEGGIRLANGEWLRALRGLTEEIGTLLIVDDIQAGCGRTGMFFSFEHFDIKPDIICLSKSLSGFGLPFAKLLFKPEYDVWERGEFTGTFRGSNLAFAAGNATIEQYWGNDVFWGDIAKNCIEMKSAFYELTNRYSSYITRSQILGMLAGFEVESTDLAKRIQTECFRSGLIVETCGPNDTTIKLMPPINCRRESLSEGFQLLDSAIEKTFAKNFDRDGAAALVAEVNG